MYIPITAVTNNIHTFFLINFLSNTNTKPFRSKLGKHVASLKAPFDIGPLNLYCHGKPLLLPILIHSCLWENPSGHLPSIHVVMGKPSRQTTPLFETINICPFSTSIWNLINPMLQPETAFERLQLKRLVAFQNTEVK
jgi:hypothetical protein